MIKKLLGLIFFLCAIVLNAQVKDASYYKAKGYQVFSKYGFVIKAPITLKSAPNSADGNFEINIGGILNENIPSRFVFYQLIIKRFPVGYVHFSPQGKQNFREQALKQGAQNLVNVKRVKVGYMGYDGIVGETTHNGYKQKGEVFIKDEYVFALTVITNDDLESKFNQFTNNLIFLQQ